MFVRDDDDETGGLHFRLKKNKKDGDTTDENRVNMRSSNDAVDLDDLLNDADSAAKSEEGGMIEI